MGRARNDPNHPRWKYIDRLRARGIRIPPTLYMTEKETTMKKLCEKAEKGQPTKLADNGGQFQKGNTARKGKGKTKKREPVKPKSVLPKNRRAYNLNPTTDKKKLRVNRNAAHKIPMGKVKGLSPEAIWVELKPEGMHPRDWWLLYPGPNYRRWGRVVRQALDKSLAELEEACGKSISDLQEGVIGEPTSR